MSALTDLALTDAFVDLLLRDSFLQAVQSQFTHQQLLDIAYEKTIGIVCPLLFTARKAFFRESYDITLVADQETYDIPSYAMGDKLYLGYLLDTDDKPHKLEQRDPPEDVFFFETTSGHPGTIRLHDKTIEINPAPSSGDISTYPTLRTWIHRRPGRFVRATTSGSNTGRAAKVSTVVSTTVTYTGTPPTDFTSSSEHDFYDSVTHRRIGTDVTATGASGSTQSFASADAALLSANDWVCLKDETVFLPFPVDLVGTLKSLTIAQIAESQGDREAMATAEAAAAKYIQTLFPAIATPIEGSPPAVTLHHSPFLRAYRRGRGMVTS